VKERQRAAYIESWGIPVFKFTGKDVYADAIAEADRVTAWAFQWAIEP
jgi:hypothetical protein